MPPSSNLNPHVVLLGDANGRRQDLLRRLETLRFRVLIFTHCHDTEGLDLNNGKYVLILLLPASQDTLNLLGAVQDQDTRRLIRLPTVAIYATKKDNEDSRRQCVRSDEYLIEPIMESELIAALRNVKPLRANVNDVDEISFGDLKLDAKSRTMTLRGLPLSLEPTQFRVLQNLMLEPDRVYTRAEIREQVWGADHVVDDRTVDAYIGRVRTRLKSRSKKLRVIFKRLAWPSAGA